MRTGKTVIAYLLLAAAGLVPLPGHAAADSADNDVYQHDASWLCQPGRHDLCADPLAVTAIHADGSTSARTWKPDPDAAIDCFYVYPTVSTDLGANSSLTPGEAEKRVVRQQFAPFASVCRPYAPMYRQVTLAGLLESGMGRNLKANAELAYADVLAAWRHYLRHDNQGRGVVLIGHSQGSHVLMRLLREEIDDQPAQKLLAGAVLAGANVEVPRNADVGGSFLHIPLCHAAGQGGCVIAYVTFRADAPPPERALFGRTTAPGMQVACTAPSALTGGAVDMALPASRNMLGKAWATADGQPLDVKIDSAFFALPGLVEAHCVDDSHGSYLAVTTLSRTAREGVPTGIPGDLVIGRRRLDNWGLHLIDVNLQLGNLVELVGRMRKPSTPP